MTVVELDTLATLDALRPPEGYRTAAALGTTYSADLVACVTAVMALDGAVFEEVRYRAMDALRALDRLRNHVRIVAQRGRVTYPSGTSRPVLGLLDAVVCQVPFDETRASFHPKVWVVRQDHESGDRRDRRYVLLIGSRNLTTMQAWDLGVTLIGWRRPGRRRTKLRGVHAFIRRVCALVGIPHIRRLLADVEDVRWELPTGIDQIEFQFSEGQRGQAMDGAGILTLPALKKVLLLSPFLDASMVSRISKHWANAEERCLVAGETDLDRVALGSRAARRALGTWASRQIGIVSEAEAPLARNIVPPADQLDSDEEEAESTADRGLHAKVVAVTTGAKRATVLFGSANLTRRAWTGANAEAYVVLEGSAELADCLWDWVRRRTLPYTMPEKVGTVASSDDRVLDQLRGRIAGIPFRLVDQVTQKRPSTLTARQPIPWDELMGIELGVARLSTAKREVMWTRPDRAVELEPCSEGQRTAFVAMRLVSKDQMLAWIQRVDVSPPIGARRDDAARIEILSRVGFSEWLRAILGGPGTADGASDDDEDDLDDGDRRSEGSWRRPTTLSLEEILRRLSRAPNVAAEVDRALQPLFRHLQRTGVALQADDAGFLREFRDVWEVIRDGVGNPR